jgi:hypothetical protein
LIQILDVDSITPVIGATITVGAVDKEPLRLVSDYRGEAYIPDNFKASNIQIKYLGKELLNMALQSWSKRNIFYINPDITLNEVSVTGYRNLVKRSLMQDIVKIKDVDIFKHENFDALLSLTPGVLQNDNGYSYFNYPITGIRFGATGVLKPVSKDMMNSIRSLFAENIDEIRFKRRTSGQGIQYELIIILNNDNNISLTPSVEGYLGKKGNVDGNMFAKFGNNKFNSTFLVDGKILNKKKGEYSIYNYGDKKTVVDVADKEAEKGFHIDYNGEYTLNKAFSAGLGINYGVDRTKKDRNSTEQLQVKHILYDPQKYHDLTSSLFLNGNFGNHVLHWEASYNRSTSNLTVAVDDIKSQHIEEKSLSPNSFLEYTFTDNPKDVSINANIAYSYLNIKDANSLAHENQDRLKEHTLTSGVSMYWTKNKFSGNGVLLLEYNKNNYYKTTSLLPKISIKYDGDKMGIECNYVKVIDRPLAWMLSTNQTIETGNMSLSGNDGLKPTVKHQIDATFTYANFIFCVTKEWLNNFSDFLANGYDEKGLLIKKWQNMGKLDSWGFSSYFNFRRKHFYMNPTISGEIGRFYNGCSWENNHYFMASLPFQLMFDNHKFSLNTTYQAKSKDFQTTTDGMFMMDFRYNLYIPKWGITLSLFARDIFNEKSTEKNRINNSQYWSSTILHKDKRQFGISIAYEFFKGTAKEINGVVNNQNRNK